MKNIIVYGAGYFGKKVYEKVSQYYSDDINILRYIDEKKDGKVVDIPIIRLTEYNTYEVPIIIALENRRTIKNVYGSLRNIGATDIYMFLNRDNPRYVGNVFLDDECVKIVGDESEIIPHVETHAVDYCNLNCKACIHYSALYNKEEQDNSAIYSDIREIAELSKDILSFYIMGGEPLLREDLSDVLELSRRTFPNSDIQLLTNGILISEHLDTLFHMLCKNNITITISEYSPTIGNRDRIKHVLESYNVPYIIRPYDSKNKFIKTISLSKDTPYKNICICNGCVNIYKGRIARCPAVMYLDRLNDTFSLDLPNSGIYKIEEFKDVPSLNKKMEEPIALCDHCVEYEIDWEQCSREHKVEDFVVV